ncbi:MAG: hypothetical protein RIS36_397 [Pseudomonadota bacterium]
MKSIVTSTFTTLRSKHPTLTYRGYTLVRHGEILQATFLIDLEPSIQFRPTISFPALSFPTTQIDEKCLEPYLFHLGMVEVLSYWKAACPPRVIIDGYQLSDDDRAWWQDLFIHGLGEFYFVNDIDPSQEGLLTIESRGGRPLPRGYRHEASAKDGELVLAAGGKDSSLALEMLTAFDPNVRRETLMLNPSRSARESITIAGYGDPIVVHRTIDRQLIELNAQGYLNGHTPFSAYLAFLGTMIAEIRGLGAVIVSNERSASEENTIFHGLAINHQYSKGIRFERRFRSYAAEHFPGCASYYSIIRPLYDLQVSGLFARIAPHHLRSFRSCNVGQREDRWCGKCPKCAFVFLTMAPFTSPSDRSVIFGKDLFEVPEILSALEELTGLRDHKPLECVGTLGESRDALALTLARCQREGYSIPSGLEAIAKKLRDRNLLPSLSHASATLTAWSEEHELPKEYARRLQNLLKELA